ncbi:MAG: SMP-30/gluconolactonase/LRE family protein [Planctomycetes bacterium]|nr:SMP-30/gluconolactonase/LRE family protein [Planctomycetota bacterium]MCC7398921.1 bifunctional YncE family protein/alkaline phosphatase family protein [Planctomycetota bacterium]
MSCRLPAFLLSALLPATAVVAQDKPRWPGPAADGSILLPNGWSLAPHGKQFELPSDLPIRMALHPKGRWLAVQHAGYRKHAVVIFDTRRREVAATHTLPRSWSGMAWRPDGAALFVSGGADDVLHNLAFDADSGRLGDGEKWTLGEPQALDLPAGIAVAGDGTLWVCTQRTDMLLHLGSKGEMLASIELGDGSFPFECVLDAAGKRLFVSLWAKAELAVIDIVKGEVAARVPTGQHPSELLLHPDGDRLFVSNGNENTVTVVDLAAGRPIETIDSSLRPGSPPGSTPNSLAITGDKLLIANADNNALAVIDIDEPGRSKPLGFVPTGFYPTSVRVVGKTVFVANGKGSIGSHANPDGPAPGKKTKTADDYSGSLFVGSLSVFPVPAADELRRLSAKALLCCPLPADGAVRGVARRPADSPIPARPGDPSPIRHVVYVLKENRTYDQIFGDMKQGNGDPELCLFGRNVTPNHHAIAEQFVLLDNFYVESEVSADGHEWSMGGYATDFVERTWPVSYGGKGTQRTPEGAEATVGYPGEGNFALGAPKSGYLWDLAKAAGLDYRSYGEWLTNAAKAGDPGVARAPALVGHCDLLYRSFDMDYSDNARVDRFLVELADFEQRGKFPNLVILRLPQDHTAGTKKGAWTPRSCVADNDLALGRLLEALSRSSFWPAMAVFVVEDDAQNGPDHVDAHRTVGLVAGPHVRRGAVVSTMYSTCSMLRTMELVLGLPPMSQFDAAAMPMFDCFQATPDLRPYVAEKNRVPLDERNGRLAYGADQSDRFDFTREDAVDDLLLNEVIWRSIRGADSPMPPPRRAAFVRSLGDDD